MAIAEVSSGQRMMWRNVFSDVFYSIRSFSNIPVNDLSVYTRIEVVLRLNIRLSALPSWGFQQGENAAWNEPRCRKWV
jgi:hypothetical protein